LDKIQVVEDMGQEVPVGDTPDVDNVEVVDHLDMVLADIEVDHRIVHLEDTEEDMVDPVVVRNNPVVVELPLVHYYFDEIRLKYE